VADVRRGQRWRHREGGEVVEVLDEVPGGDVTTWHIRRLDNGEESHVVEGALITEYELVDDD
jgi:hypothetical protein